MKKRRFIFSSFSLKLIALITMTIDHIGAILLYNLGYANTFIYIFLRFIGRFALPLFAFMIVEGVIHTKKPWRYFLRLAGAAFFIGLVLFLGNLWLGEQVVSGNIFVDLLMGGLAVYFLRLKGEKKLLALLPTAYIVVAAIFSKDPYGWFPFFMTPDYHMYGFTMIVGYYLGYLFITESAKKQCLAYAIDFDGYKLTDEFRYSLNVAASISLLTVNIIWYIIAKVNPEWDFVSMWFQSFSILAAFILIYYNGKRGYDAAWFRYGAYVYYPVHLAIIYALSLLIAYL